MQQKLKETRENLKNTVFWIVPCISFDVPIIVFVHVSENLYVKNGFQPVIVKIGLGDPGGLGYSGDL